VGVDLSKTPSSIHCRRQVQGLRFSGDLGTRRRQVVSRLMRPRSSCFALWGFRCRVEGLAFRVSCVGFGVAIIGLRVKGFGCRMKGERFRVKGLGFGF
jgi:hypothetical protein